MGVYDNPLWIHGPEETIIEGTDNITFKDLRYKQGEDNVLYPDADDGFWWVVANHKGAESTSMASLNIIRILVWTLSVWTFFVIMKTDTTAV